MSQPINIKLIIKTIENLQLHFIKVRKILNQMTPINEILCKENKNIEKRGEFAKTTTILCKLVVPTKKDHLRKIKPFWRAKYISKDKWPDLSLEMQTYKLTSYHKKNKYFQKS